MHAFRTGLFALAAVLWAGGSRGFALEAASGEIARVEFNRDVRPILSDKCFQCHGPDASQRKADLRLDLPEGAEAAASGEAVVVPGKPEESELFRRITHESRRKRMPPARTGKDLTEREVEAIRRWILQGAEYQSHWSTIPPARPEPPEVRDGAWPRGAIDRFVLAKLESAGLRPSPEADRITLLRRVSFDLTGLPPARPDVEEFLNDERPGAFERLVDRLLASPHHGERMAMYWLDLVRYADTVGYHGDQEHPISPYRDWVIHAFIENMPFDQFTVEQLAGDLLPDPTTDQRIATGYNRLLQTTHEGGAQDGEYRAKYAADRVRNLSGVWMGATMGCAECHDHKYDPYTQRDFYSMAAFFADVEEQGAYRSPDASPTTRPPEIEVVSPLERSGPAPPKRRTMVTVSTKPRVIRVLPRGDWMDTSGEVVAPAIPEFMGRLETGGGRATRLDLARWLTSREHPQTARVLANRVWYLFFGAGISRTLDDTGSQGEWPSHPALLDWLAVELIESGWDVRHLVRLVVTSSAYRQSSIPSPELERKDPANRLFARQARFRLPAEMVRDTALAVSGLLVRRLGGPSARPYQPAGHYAHLNFPPRTYTPDTGEDQYRRGLYTHWQRQFLHPMLKAFDAPSREECTARRPASNTPLQALVLLNDPSLVEAARVFAARILREGGRTPEDRVRWACEEALSRAPEADEADALVRLHSVEHELYGRDPDAARKLLGVGLAPAPPELEPAELAAWTSVARALLNLSETITRN